MALKLLEGMKVIEIAAFMAAPMGGRILGEWGADVIKALPAISTTATRPVGTPSTPASAASRSTPANPKGWPSSKRC